MTLNLDPIKARANAATEGPWKFTPKILGIKNTTVMAGGEQVGYFSVGQAQPHDAEFIAAARTDIPALIAEVERLRHQLSHVEVDRDHYKNQSAEVERLRAIVGRVREVHAPIDALNTRYNQVQKVCTGCGTDDGNWQNWPCPTIRALEGE